MKITVTRSYSKKVQLRQFEPIDSFCSISIEAEFPNPMGKGKAEESTEWIRRTSEAADRMCREEVEATLANIRPSMKAMQGKGKPEQKEISKLNAELDAGNEYPD